VTFPLILDNFYIYDRMLPLWDEVGMELFILDKTIPYYLNP